MSPGFRAAVVLAAVGLVPAMAMAQARVTPLDATPTSSPPAPTAARPSGASTKTKNAAKAKQAPDAIMPGFETLADGSTRLFVELSRAVAFEARTNSEGTTYVLKGARVERRNNYNPLVTTHFNTPVTSARLVPHGKDLWFVVALRAKVLANASMDATADGTALLRIDFPKGDYLPASEATPASSASASPTARGSMP